MNVNSGKLADLGFSYCLGIGPVTYSQLVAKYGSSEKAYSAPQGELSKLIGSSIAQSFDSFRNKFDTGAEYQKLLDDQITIINRRNKSFSQLLAEIPDPPICLYIKGDLSQYDFGRDLMIGVVGTRRPTTYGVQVASLFSRELAGRGAVIVSGMALGIDTVSHMGALGSGGRTIAFLGCGVNIIYPPANHMLYAQIIKNRGLVISEFPPNMTVKPGLFISRNRLISGISRGVLVVEGRKNSGSLVTARYALNQGRDVFAPPSPITSPESEAPNILLKEGAILALSPSDVLNEYGVSTTGKKSTAEVKQKLSPGEQEVFDLIIREKYLPDELSRKTKRPVYEILSNLSSLELCGVIQKTDDGYYVRVV